MVYNFRLRSKLESNKRQSKREGDGGVSEMDIFE